MSQKAAGVGFEPTGRLHAQLAIPSVVAPDDDSSHVFCGQPSHDPFAAADAYLETNITKY